MTRREYTVEEVVLAHDILGYMLENDVSLEQAYEDKGVSNEMRLLEDELEEIRTAYLV